MNEKKLQKLMKDEAFVKELAQLKTKEEVQELLKSNGIEFTMEELEEFEREGTKLLQDGDLANISGGGFRHFIGGVEAPAVGLAESLSDFYSAATLRCTESKKEYLESGLSHLAGSTVGLGLIIGAYEGIKYGVKSIKKAKNKGQKSIK